jgi:hypothetical protein
MYDDARLLPTKSPDVSTLVSRYVFVDMEPFVLMPFTVIVLILFVNSLPIGPAATTYILPLPFLPFVKDTQTCR